MGCSTDQCTHQNQHSQPQNSQNLDTQPFATRWRACNPQWGCEESMEDQKREENSTNGELCEENGRVVRWERKRFGECGSGLTYALSTGDYEYIVYVCGVLVYVWVFVCGVYVGPGRRRAASDPGGHPCEWGRCGGGPSDVAWDVKEGWWSRGIFVLFPPFTPYLVNLLWWCFNPLSECCVKCQVESVVCCSHRLPTRGLCSFVRLWESFPLYGGKVVWWIAPYWNLIHLALLSIPIPCRKHLCPLPKYPL